MFRPGLSVIELFKGLGFSGQATFALAFPRNAPSLCGETNFSIRFSGERGCIMTGQKRSFPYYSSVSEIDLKRRAVEGVNPGEEAADANIYEAPTTSGPRTLVSRKHLQPRLTGAGLVSRNLRAEQRVLCACRLQRQTSGRGQTSSCR